LFLVIEESIILSIHSIYAQNPMLGFVHDFISTAKNKNVAA
jgi:hypothetical protein